MLIHTPQKASAVQSHTIEGAQADLTYADLEDHDATSTK